MNRDLTDEENGTPAQRAKWPHRRRPLLPVTTHQDPKGNPRQDQTGAGSRAATTAAQAL